MWAMARPTWPAPNRATGRRGDRGGRVCEVFTRRDPLECAARRRRHSTGQAGAERIADFGFTQLIARQRHAGTGNGVEFQVATADVPVTPSGVTAIQAPTSRGTLPVVRATVTRIDGQLPR